MLRFTRSERVVHWLTAVAFFSLVISGLVVGRRGTFHNVMYAWHLASAGVLVAGVVLVFVAGNRRALEGSARDLLQLGAEDRHWLASAPSRLRAHVPMPATGRFNAGQKLNFVLVCVLLVVLYVSGVDTVVEGTHHNLLFGLHKVATIAAGILVAGHVYMAIVNRDTRAALRGMLTGEVDRDWAYEHYPVWTSAQPTPTRPGEREADRYQA